MKGMLYRLGMALKELGERHKQWWLVYLGLKIKDAV